MATAAINAALAASREASQAALTASEVAAAALASAKSKLWWQVLAQAVVWLVMAIMAYGTVNTRLEVLEVKYDRISQDIAEMKTDVKTLLLRQGGK